MANKSQFQAIKGTRDLLPPETALWNQVEQTAREVFATFHFGEIRPPIFESTELFARAVGGDTDIVGKEMYTFPDQPASTSPTAPSEEKGSGESSASQPSSATSISLRPEATASVCRAYIEHSMQQLPQPVKLYYIGPMFRRERPQKGRYRQFYQIGAEVLGGQDAPAIDAEVIEMLMTFFDKLNLKGLELDINSIGHKDKTCRLGYIENLREALLKISARFGEDSARRIATNPLRVLDSKAPNEQPLIETLPKITDYICDACKAHYEALKIQLRLRGILYRENWRLVRGLDYYMRTTFEITAKGLGSQNAVCGGGRYDGLVEELGGPPTKGIGFAIGEDRLILSLQEQAREAAEAQGTATEATNQSPFTAKKPPLIFIAWMGQNTYATAVRAAKDLRNAGFPVEVPPNELKFGKALGQADKLGAQFALILGEDEVSEGSWTLKNLADGNQIKLPEPDLIAHLRSL